MKDWQREAAKWSKGEIVWSAELGGMGPGYEQAIQCLLWEILVRWKGDAPEVVKGAKEYPPAYSVFVDTVVSGLKDFGFSGAQVGAAKATAFQFMVYGYDHMMAKLPEDRKIMVSRDFPSLPKEAS